MLRGKEVWNFPRQRTHSSGTQRLGRSPWRGGSPQSGKVPFQNRDIKRKRKMERKSLNRCFWRMRENKGGFPKLRVENGEWRAFMLSRFYFMLNRTLWHVNFWFREQVSQHLYCGFIVIQPATPSSFAQAAPEIHLPSMSNPEERKTDERGAVR